MRAFLSSPKIDDTSSNCYATSSVFAEAAVVMGAIQWPNGANLAPDSMYGAVSKCGLLVLTEEGTTAVSNQ